MFKILLCLLMAFPFVAFAEEESGPCRKDRETLCPNMKHGEGLHACMKKNEDKISPECKAFKEAAKAQKKEVREACHGDVETLCPGIADKKAIRHCLRENIDKVSESCQAEWKELKEIRKRK